MMGLYTITTLASWGIYYLVERAYKERLERRELAYTDVSLYEKAFDYAQTGFKLIVPGYNIYSTVKMLWEGNDYLEKREKEDLKSGKIFRTDSYRLEDDMANLEKQSSVLINKKEKTPEERIRELELEKERLIKTYLETEPEEKSYQKRI